MLKKLNKSLHTPLWLFGLLLIVLILRIPSFFEPYAYGDEMIYLVLGEALRQGVPLYQGIHDNKPPLLYVMAGISGSLFVFRVILALWNFVTIYIFWKLLDHLFPKNKAIQIVGTTIFAVLTTLPLLEGNIANAEIFMIGTTIAAFYILLTRKLTPTVLISSGFLLSISILFKVPALFDIPAIVLYWILTVKISTKNILAVSKQTLYLALGVVVPIALTFVWYYFQGALHEYLIAAFGQNVGYLSSFRPGDKQEPFLVRNAPLLMRAAVVTTGIGFLAYFRKKLSKQYLFATLWLLVTLFAVTLSERPYPHYLIQSIPPLSILIGMLVGSQKIEQVLAIFPITVFLFTPYYYNFWKYPTIPYYQRFLSFATGAISVDDYKASFGGNVVRNYKIADYILQSGTDDTLFVWGDNASLYALTRKLPPNRFSVDYHIFDFYSTDKTLADLYEKEPTFIVVLPDSPEFPGLQTFLRKNYGLTETIDGAEIWRVLSPTIKVFLQ